MGCCVSHHKAADDDSEGNNRKEGRGNDQFSPIMESSELQRASSERPQVQSCRIPVEVASLRPTVAKVASALSMNAKWKPSSVSTCPHACTLSTVNQPAANPLLPSPKAASLVSVTEEETKLRQVISTCPPRMLGTGAMLRDFRLFAWLDGHEPTINGPMDYSTMANAHETGSSSRFSHRSSTLGSSTHVKSPYSLHLSPFDSGLCRSPNSQRRFLGASWESSSRGLEKSKYERLRSEAQLKANDKLLSRRPVLLVDVDETESFESGDGQKPSGSHPPPLCID